MNKPASGMEMMLRSMGLGDVITAAQAFVENGTVQKIVQFADQTEVLILEQQRTQRMLRAIAAHVGVADAAVFGIGNGDGGASEPRLALPGPSTGHRSDTASCGDADVSSAAANGALGGAGK
jgi:hypothetical protein